jgi:hypothetical protein
MLLNYSIQIQSLLFQTISPAQGICFIFVFLKQFNSLPGKDHFHPGGILAG